MNMIESSELIINARGAIYHLDLRPEEIGDTIITVGDPFRVEKVSKHFDQILYKSQHREFITHTGRIGNKSVSVISTGIGPDNIDIVMNELDALVNIDLVNRTINPAKKQLKLIRVGTSGSLQPHIDVDNFVASTYGLGLDNLMHYYPVQQTEIEIELLSNFKFPYFSRDVAEFWRRWHISLSSWFRDYLYSPLGGSKNGKYKSIRNTFIIFLVSGFWHGASWNFIAWGFIHACGFLPLLLLNRNRKHVTDVVAQDRKLPNLKEQVIL
jgi:hypothetical protein